MTDLTNAEKYTAQFGFEEGVVVEVQDHEETMLGFFNCINDSKIVIDQKVEISGTAWAYDALAIPFTEIKSIRVLTGPFRYWSEDVPDWAEVHHAASFGLSKFENDTLAIKYLPEGAATYWSRLVDMTPEAREELNLERRILNSSYSITARPWWCTKKETKNAKED